jgi:hypothetical protein
VQRAFPVLAEYPRARIQFDDWSRGTGGEARTGEAPAQYPPSAATWSRILEEAWPLFRNSPPQRLRVTIKETAEDVAARE